MGNTTDFSDHDTMIAVIKEKPERGLKVTRRPIPKDINDDEVLIKVLATSICGTDYHIYDWDEWSQNRINPPQIMGHELAGEVIKIGKNVTNVKLGDIVSAETHIVCEVCEQCLDDKKHVCQNTKIIGVDIDGCFAEYVKLPAVNLLVNDPSIDPKYLCIQEPLGNAVHTMMEFDIKGKDVAIVGCGPIGLMAIRVAKAVGARKVIAVEVNEYRYNFAKELGADVVINPIKEDVVATVLKHTNGGVDVVGEFSGNEAAISAAFKYLKLGGAMSMLGIPKKPFVVDISSDIVFKGIKIYGVVGRKMFKTWEQMKELIATGKLELEKLVTHVYDLTDVQKGMDVMESGNSGKVVLIPNLNK